MIDLFPHQKEGIAFLKEKGHAILADEMGLGKTRQAIVAAGETSDKPTLIVCPASLKINWQREIHMVYPEDVVAVISGGDPEEGQARVDYASHEGAAWIIINYDILDKHKVWLTERAKEDEIGCLILDEAHYAKDTKAIRTKAVLAIALHVKQVYALTGTPLTNRPIELFALLRAVKHPLAYKDGVAVSVLRRAFGKRYCAAYFHRLGYSGRGFWDETGSSRLPELRVMTMDAILRRTKDEVLDLPPKIITLRSVQLGPEWQRKYDRAWEEYLAWVEAHPEQNKNIGNVLSAQALIELGKLKQVCSQAKVLQIVDDIVDAVDQGQKVIVFSQFTSTVEHIQQSLRTHKITSVTLTGSTSQEDRQLAVDSFQKYDDTKVFIANIKAGGVGITLTAASIVIFADMDWSPETHRQAEDRAHRIGQTGTVNIYYYIAENTIEDDIIDILSAKQETIGTVTGGDTTIKPFMDRLKSRMANQK